MKLLSEHLDIIICILTALLSYFVGRCHQLFIENRNMIAIRFQKLYAPFEKEYLRNGPGAFRFTDLSKESQKKFLDILIDNYEYTDSNLKTLIYEFRCAIVSEDTDAENHIFFKIASSIDISFNQIGKKLFLKPHKF